MAEYTKQIHYRLNNATNDIKLYTTVEEVGANYVSLMDGGATVYAPLVGVTDANASDISVRKGGQTFAIGLQAVQALSDPELLRQRTIEGTHTTYYQVGDYFNITLNGKVSDSLTFANETYRAVIVGFDHNKELETGGQNSTTLAICQDTLGNEISFIEPANIRTADVTSGDHFAHHLKKSTNAGGWSSSLIRTVIMPNFYNALPSEWQSVISSITKYTDNTGKASKAEANVTATTEKVFIPAEYEITGPDYWDWANVYEKTKQRQYEYFADWQPDTSTSIRRGHNDPTKNYAFWTRSQDKSTASKYSRLSAVGADSSYGYKSFGMLPFFTITNDN